MHKPGSQSIPYSIIIYDSTLFSDSSVGMRHLPASVRDPFIIYLLSILRRQNGVMYSAGKKNLPLGSRWDVSHTGDAKRDTNRASSAV